MLVSVRRNMGSTRAYCLFICLWTRHVTDFAAVKTLDSMLRKRLRCALMLDEANHSLITLRDKLLIHVLVSCSERLSVFSLEFWGYIVSEVSYESASIG
jgi:hypothetical protein